jgi:hypothetical protein
MKLTRNFSLQELTKSDTAIRKGIDNEPNADQIDKLKTQGGYMQATYLFNQEVNT